MINFPATTGQPTDGSFTHSEVGLTWTWNGTTWDVEGGGGAAGPDGCYIGDTPPAGAEPGWLWWNSAEGILYVWYDDGDTQQWVEANPGVPGPAGAAGPAGPTAVSVDAGNSTRLGTDGLVFTPTPPSATETVAGLIEIATADEARSWNDLLRAMTPGNLKQSFLGWNSSLAANGFQRLPSGVLIQWGSTPIVPGSGTGQVTFPIAFPVRLAAFIPAGGKTLSAQNSGLVAGSGTLASAGVTNFGPNQVDAGSYIAIGY
jgi:hypothetical protein